jgi:hypothetical protein
MNGPNTGKEKKKKILGAIWEPFGICLLNITANPAQSHPNWAESIGCAI